MSFHVFACDIPNRQQYTMPLVITRAILMRLPEVAKCDRAVDRSDDFGKANVLRRAGQNVSATDSTFGLYEAGALECQQDLLEIRLG